MTIFKVKRSTVTEIPPDGSLVEGEFAFSYPSRKLFVGDASGNPIPVGGLGVIEENAASPEDLDATQIAYDNPNYTTVDAALDNLLFYPMSVNLSGGGTYEYGQTITDVNLSWSANKDISSQSLNNGIGTLDPTLRSYSHSGQSITSNTTYTITVTNDGSGETKNNSTYIRFRHRRYWGTSSETSLNDTQLQALSNELSTGRTQNRTLSASGEYFYFAYPASWGAASFKINGLQNTAWQETIRDVTNQHGHVESYRLYRSDFLQNGSGVEIEVY